MDISFKCDNCGQNIVVDQAGAGEIVECPKCKTSVMVPVGSGTTGPLPLLPRVPTVTPKVIVEKIQGLPLTVKTANEPLQVEIVGLRVSWGEALNVTAKVVCCLLVFSIIGAIISKIITAIVATPAVGVFLLVLAIITAIITAIVAAIGNALRK